MSDGPFRDACRPPKAVRREEIRETTASFVRAAFMPAVLIAATAISVCGVWYTVDSVAEDETRYREESIRSCDRKCGLLEATRVSPDTSPYECECMRRGCLIRLGAELSKVCP